MSIQKPSDLQDHFDSYFARQYQKYLIEMIGELIFVQCYFDSNIYGVNNEPLKIIINPKLIFYLEDEFRYFHVLHYGGLCERSYDRKKLIWEKRKINPFFVDLFNEVRLLFWKLGYLIFDVSDPILGHKIILQVFTIQNNNYNCFLQKNLWHNYNKLPVEKNVSRSPNNIIFLSYFRNIFK